MEFIKQQITESIEINSKFPEKKLNAEWMSYDKNVHKVVVPVKTQSGIAFQMDEVEAVLVYLKYPKGSFGPFEGKVEDEEQRTVSFEVPDEVRGQTGTVNISVMLNLSGGRQVDLVKFTATARLSAVDSEAPAMQEYYLPMYEDLVADIEVQKEKLDAASIYSKAEVDSKVADLDSVKADKTFVDAQLAQTAEDISKVEKETIYDRKSNSVGPMVSFQSDDGPRQDYTVVFPYAKEKNVPFTLGIINYSALPVEHILELQNEHGWDVHSHTVTHPRLSQISPEQLDHEMKASKEYLQSIGVKVDSVMYPYGDASKEVIDAARKYYRAGFGSQQEINRAPIDPYSIKRISLDSHTVEECKQYVDEIGDDGWIVFYTHPATMEEGQRYPFMDLIDYVQEKQIPIVTCGEALDIYENRLSIGNKAYNGEYAFIGANGKHDFSSLPLVYKKSTADVNAKRPVDFEARKVTMNAFRTGSASDIPFDAGIGTLITNRMSHVAGQFTFNTQTFYGYNGTVVQRKGMNADTWGAWTSEGMLNTVKTKAYTNETPLTDYPDGRITSTSFLSSDNSGLPDTGIGTLVTSRVGDGKVTHYQLFYPYNKADLIYRRVWTGSAWGKWAKFSSAPIYHNETIDYGTLGANSTTDFTVEVLGVGVNYSTTVDFRQGLPSGVMCNIRTNGNDSVIVRLANITSTEKTVGSRITAISAIKDS